MTNFEVPFVVSAEWVKEKMEDKSYDMVILDSSYSRDVTKDMKGDYRKCHIPGASYFDLDYKTTKTPDFTSPMPSREDFQEYACSLGVSNSSHVIVYDNSGDGGFYFGGRTWFTFILFGLNKVSIIDNGIHEWKKNGYPTTDVVPTPKYGDFVARRRDELYRGISEIEENLTSKKYQLIDARPDHLYNGDPKEPRSGHIPNSISFSFGKKLLNPETGRIRNTDDFKRLFAEHDVDLTKPIIATCRSGMSACCLIMALIMSGATNYSLYHGSATEWLRNAKLENIKQVPKVES